jgi:hypothetical protein
LRFLTELVLSAVEGLGMTEVMGGATGTGMAGDGGPGVPETDGKSIGDDISDGWLARKLSGPPRKGVPDTPEGF